MPNDAAPWLLLMHHLPPRPDYLRVKVRRRLAKLGAVQVKPSVYALPSNEENREDLHWLRREIVGDGGVAIICEARLLDGLTDGQLRAQLQSQIEDNMEVKASVLPPHASAGERVTWVTRRGVKVDRMSSAWLIRRFIDPEARFRFVAPDEYEHAAGEVQFDMYDGEYTHEGNRCTFEVLATRHGIDEAGVSAIAEIVHDLDMKDDLYGRRECAGVKAAIAGIGLTTSDDMQRIDRGMVLFDALHAALAEA